MYLQVVTLNECGQEIKKQLREHQKRCTLIIEEYSSELREKGDTLDDVWSSINQMRKGWRDTEVVHDFSTIARDIDSCQAVKFKQAPRLPRITYLHKGSAGKAVPTKQLMLCGLDQTLTNKIQNVVQFMNSLTLSIPIGNLNLIKVRIQHESFEIVNSFSFTCASHPTMINNVYLYDFSFQRCI